MNGYAWAMVLDEDGQVIWHYNLPEELDHRYTASDVARFSRWYLDGYPVFCWTEETIRFRRDAAEAVGYDASIAAQLKPWLPEHARLCDAGCGLGYLSLALAGSCAHVTAVDIAPAPLAVLRQQAERTHTANLTVTEGDIFTM